MAKYAKIQQYEVIQFTDGNTTSGIFEGACVSLIKSESTVNDRVVNIRLANGEVAVLHDTDYLIKKDGQPVNSCRAEQLPQLYESMGTYTLTYNGNTNTGGSAPTDASSPYDKWSTPVTAAAGTLVKSTKTFSEWNTAADGSGTAYAVGAAINPIIANTVLYAQWV